MRAIETTNGYSWLDRCAQWVMPWLLSSVTHMLVLLLLALLWTHPNGAGVPGKTTGISLQAMVITTLGPEDAEGSPDGVEVGSSGPQSRYYADEVDAPVRTAQPQLAGGSPGNPLAAALVTPAPVNLAGVLPTNTGTLGSSGLEGAGVGSAAGLTSGARANKNLRGGYARTGVFGVSGEGHKFVYVFDRSGSMDGHGGAPLSAA